MKISSGRTSRSQFYLLAQWSLVLCGHVPGALSPGVFSAEYLLGEAEAIWEWLL